MLCCVTCLSTVLLSASCGLLLQMTALHCMPCLELSGALSIVSMVLLTRLQSYSGRLSGNSWMPLLLPTPSDMMCAVVEKYKTDLKDKKPFIKQIAIAYCAKKGSEK